MKHFKYDAKIQNFVITFTTVRATRWQIYFSAVSVLNGRRLID